MDRDQRVRDPIHNLIGFSHSEPEDALLWSLIRTREVQRLRRIKQLGFSEYVYPGATHSRFSHVLGAMQMARRMLAVFERNDVFDAAPADHKLMRKATLAAALLHDVGHGPYSHVFEELTSARGIEAEHENYTRDIIKTEQISGVLKSHGIYDKTLAFFEKERDFTPYATIISSQMDCDRLDFLCRDRYFSGLHSSYIDLEWLFDSLAIEKVITDLAADVSEYSFVVKLKGVRVIEEYVFSYLKMYNDVYFHKATRSVQHVVSEALLSALNSYSDDPSLRAQPLFRFFADAEWRSTETYVSLDDSSVLSLLHALSSGTYGRATELANRFLKRDLFKCIEIAPEPNGGIRNQFIKRFIDRLKAEGLWFKLDLISGKSVKQYEVSDKKFLENIMIKQADGEHGRLHQVSQVVRSIPGQTVRIYFDCAADRDRAKAIFAAVG